MADLEISRDAVQAGVDAYESAFLFDGTAEMVEHILKGAAPYIAAVHADRINRLTAQRDEARHALTRVMPAARTTEEIQADAGAIRFGWGPRFAALLEDLLDEDDLMAVLAAWETLLREQVSARAALEAITDPHGAQS